MQLVAQLMIFRVFNFPPHPFSVHTLPWETLTTF